MTNNEYYQQQLASIYKKMTKAYKSITVKNLIKKVIDIMNNKDVDKKTLSYCYAIQSKASQILNTCKKVEEMF
jgi:hypothetical protein